MSVLLIAVALVALGLILRLPGRMILAMLALLWLGVMLALLALPENHAMRSALGGDWRPWAALGVAVAAFSGYRGLLSRLKARAG
ncbi:MAG: molybdopterin biosynthesis protein, partial [Albidovulum sp.]